MRAPQPRSSHLRPLTLAGEGRSLTLAVRWGRGAFAVAVALAAAAVLSAPAARAAECVTPAQCDGGPCVDDVCCDTACDGPCEACSAAAKVSGVDGVCGQAKAGKVCAEHTCEGELFYTGPSTCDAQGQCVAPLPVNCLHTNPCKLDLCGSDGCEIVLKNDFVPCGPGQVCIDGECVANPSASSSSASSGASSASGSAGTGGSGGAGGSGGGSTGTGDPYPPKHEPSCGCRVVGDGREGGMIAAAIAALAILRRRRNG